MTEKEFFALALENELPDFEEIEKKCVCELRKKDNKNISTKAKVLSVAAVLLLLVGVSGILMLSGTNADGVVLPDVSVYRLWVTDDFGGCGYSDVNFFEYTDNGTIYNDFEKDVELTDYVPPLFKNDYFNYIDEDEENTQAIQADIIAELKKYLELIDFDFDDLVFVEDEYPEELSTEVLLDANTCVLKKSFYNCGYLLYVNIKNEVCLKVDNKSVSLHYYADYPVTQNARLCGNGTYGEVLLDDVYFCALAQYFGADKLAYVDNGDREEDWLPLLIFYNTDAKNNQELLDSFYVLSLRASAAFYAEGFVSVSACDNIVLAGEIETEIPFVGYENA
ncbi:MAG: hypothetical protein IJE93_00445, partial [Clostridia bacterium]|nr:hypothetical protein [Clostridia bacterium]